MNYLTVVLQEAQKAAYEAMQVAAEQQAAGVPVQDAPIPQASSAPAEKDAMEVEAEALIADVITSTKRKAEDDGPAESSKKARVGELFEGDFCINTLITL